MHRFFHQSKEATAATATAKSNEFVSVFCLTKADYKLNKYPNTRDKNLVSSDEPGMRNK